jgi:hypothetical protein
VVRGAEVGQDKYVPVFDPSYDTFESVRERSPMLFDVICAVGCRAECGKHLLVFEFSRTGSDKK